MEWDGLKFLAILLKCQRAGTKPLCPLLIWVVQRCEERLLRTFLIPLSLAGLVWVSYLWCFGNYYLYWQVDLRYSSKDQGSLQVVVAPVLRFIDVGYNANVKIGVSSPSCLSKFGLHASSNED